MTGLFPERLTALRRNVLPSVVLLLRIGFLAISSNVPTYPCVLTFDVLYYAFFSFVKKKTISIVVVIDFRGYLVNSPLSGQIFSVYFIIIMSAYHDLSKTVSSAANTSLADLAQFAHKPDQLKLKLGRSQLSYPENLGLVQQEATQHHQHSPPLYILLLC